MSGVSSVAVQRLRKDAARLAKDPVPFISAVPLPSNILEWHYAVQGPPGSLYEGGIYHGKLLFPREYPFKPPSIYMLTPNGRFKTNTRLCLSMSDFHPDTWNPAWSVATILTGLLSFMLETSPTLGSIETSDFEKRQFAKHSGPYNLKNKTFKELFPELCETIRLEVEGKKQNEKSQCSNAEASTGGMVSADGVAGDSKKKENDKNDGSVKGANTNHVRNNTNGFVNGSTVSNLLVFAGVIAFVFVAKYVLQTAD